jgi:predicted RNA-binding Zn-ribbon protein involved in translation (DUF1610 family)
MKPPIDMQQLLARIEAQRALIAHIPVQPCPFCGEVADLRAMLDQWYAECVNCGAAGPIADTPEVAATRWNEAKR